MNQKLICKTIQSWESTYKLAGNGLEALEKTALEHFDFILMDIHMPELDGFETTLAIRKDEKNPNRNVPIIALTAAALSDDKRRAQEVGMNGFLTKPIAPKVLRDHIVRSIQSSDPHRKIEISNAEKQIDMHYLLDLSNGDMDFVVEVMDTFLAQTPISLKNLSLSVQQKDWEQVSKIVHKLKPNFAVLGLKDLHKQTLDIESVSKNIPFDPDQMTHLTEAFISDALAVMPFLVKQKKTASLHQKNMSPKKRREFPK